MDALFFLKHSRADDLEIKYALRGIARHAPWIRKVWIFGDRPAFLSDNTQIVEHVPHEALAWMGRYRTPVHNTFLMFYLTALLPELSEEYLFFNDDFILLRDWPEEDACRIRYLEDLKTLKSRGRGLWKDSLWRTYDTLKRLGYGSLNFETHVPTYFRKRWVLDAARDFQNYISEDRFYGLLAETAILNHVCKSKNLPLVHLGTENSRAGFWGKPASRKEILEKIDGKIFLSFDDDGFSRILRAVLAERFPTPCRYERQGPGIDVETFEITI